MLGERRYDSEAMQREQFGNRSHIRRVLRFVLCCYPIPSSTLGKVALSRLEPVVHPRVYFVADRQEIIHVSHS